MPVAVPAGGFQPLVAGCALDVEGHHAQWVLGVPFAGVGIAVAVPWAETVEIQVRVSNG